MKQIEKGLSTISEYRESHLVSISPRFVTRWLLIIIALLVVLSLIGQIIKFTTGHGNLFGFVPKFDLHEENNIPTYFETLLFIFSSLLLGIIARLKYLSSDRFRNHWLVLSLIFLLLSIDETASLHEQWSHPVKLLFETSGLLYYAWVIPAIPLVALTGLYFLKFLISLPTQIRNLIIVAALLFVGGAIGMELIEGWYIDAYKGFDLTYNLLVTVEEILEMVGLVIFIRALSIYLRMLNSKLSFQFTN